MAGLAEDVYLNTVQTEIDLALKEAENALESFVTKAEFEQLKVCCHCLHQVASILNILELYSAECLAKEIEAVANELLNQTLDLSQHVLQLMMQGILQLPKYLSYIRTIGQENGQAILPLLNELRELRGKKLIDEGELYNPVNFKSVSLSLIDSDMNSESSVCDESIHNVTEKENLLDKMHQLYQYSITNLSKADQVEEHLERLFKVLVRLEKLSKGTLTTAVWQVSLAFIEVQQLMLQKARLNEQEYHKNVAVFEDGTQRLLSQIGAFLQECVIAKRLDKVTAPFETLLRTLLFSITRSLNMISLVEISEKEDSWLDYIIQLYELKDQTDKKSLGEGKTKSKVFPLYWGVDKRALVSLIEVLKEEVLSIQTNIDFFVRGERADNRPLEPILQTLKQVTATLDVLELDQLVAAFDRYIQILTSLLAQSETVDSDWLIDFSQDLLWLDAVLQNMRVKNLDFVKSHQEVMRKNIEEAQQRLLNGCLEEFIFVKEAVTVLVNATVTQAGSAHDQAALEEPVIDQTDLLLSSLKKIYSNLQMLGLHLGASIIQKCYEFFCQSGSDISSQKLSQIIPIISGIEYYLELSPSITAPNHEALKDLQVVMDTLSQSLVAPSASVDANASELFKTEIEIENTEDTENIELTEADIQGVEDPPEERVDQAAEFDNEMLEIFAEEAEEVIADLKENIDLWQQRLSDTGALKTLCRGFHNLKGSGRMVKADKIGEFAWVFEDLLNKILERLIEGGPDHVQLVKAATQVLPEMLDDFINKRDISDHYLQLQQQAAVIARGNSINNARKNDDNNNDDDDDDDDELLEIFIEEGLGHVEAIDQALKSESGLFEVSKILHTLRGSANMANITGLIDVVNPLESFVAKCCAYAIEVSDDVFRLIRCLLPDLHETIVQLRHDPMKKMANQAEFFQALNVLVKRYFNLDTIQDLMSDKGEGEPLSQLETLLTTQSLEPLIDAEILLEATEQFPNTVELMVTALNETLKISRLITVLPESFVKLITCLLKKYREFHPGQHEVSENHMVILKHAHAALLKMLDDLAYGEPVSSGVDVLNELVTLSWASPHSQERAIIDRLDPEVMAVFLDEANDIIESNEDLLHQWFSDASNVFLVKELQRDFHTLKGGAKMAGILPVAALSHQLEVFCEACSDGRFEPTQSLFRLVYTCHLRLIAMMQPIQAGELVEEANDLIGWLEGFLKNGESALDLAQLFDLPDHWMPTQELNFESSDVKSVGADVEPIPEKTAEPKFSPEIMADIASLTSDDFDADVFDIFIEEADELAEQYELVFSSWRDKGEDPEKQNEVKRVLHTFKGSARLSGLTELGKLGHELESFLEDQADSLEKNTEFFDSLHIQYEQMMSHFNILKQAYHGELPVGELDDAEEPSIEPRSIESVEKVSALPEQNTRSQESYSLVESESSPAIQPTDAMAFNRILEEGLALPPNAEVGHLTETVKRAANRASSTDRRNQQQEMVKVKGGLLEKLVNLAGETTIASGRVETQISFFRKIMDEMSNTIFRMKDLIRRLDIESEAQMSYRKEQNIHLNEDFDPLEMDRYSLMHQLTRSLAETTSDVIDLKDAFTNNIRMTESLLMEQGRINTELQEGLKRTQLVPFSRMIPRLKRVVRQISTELAKEVELEVVNSEGEMDRNVLERLVAPLEHMLRNAVDHGIESADIRQANEKPPVGRILLHLAREGGDIVLRLSDDGKGLNLESIKKKAIAQGLMAADALLTDSEIMQFIFKPGFSTAEKVTQISGRGVGMDVVYSEIKQLGGGLKIHSAPGVGSQFTIRLPFTVSVNRALMVKVQEDAYAIPLLNIEGIVRISPNELKNYYRNPSQKFGYAGKQYRMQYLGYYVHGRETPDLKGQEVALPVLLIRSGSDAIALQVDSLVGSREIVVKSLGVQLSAVSGISGATILGDGSVVIILDLIALLQAEHAVGMKTVRTQSVELEFDGHPEHKHRERPLIMVVDDSVTVRKVTSRLLERKGMDVLLAKDGVAAMTLLHERIPDLMLLDIEMPRMDGFEVASQCQHDEAFSKIPIIMITSRTGEKHQKRAQSLGVKGYMGKPYQETLLLEMIEKVLSRESVRS